MRRSVVLAPLAAPLLGVSATLYGALPTWALPCLFAVTTALAAAQVAVTQVIRLRASNRITCSADNLRILEIEDLPHRQPQARPAPASAGRTHRPADRRAARERHPQQGQTVPSAEDSPPI